MATISTISVSDDGTNLTVTFNTSVDISAGVAGFLYGVNVSPVWWIDVAGAVTNQSVVVPLADLGATSGDTVNVDCGYSLTNPAGTKVYASDEGTAAAYVVGGGSSTAAINFTQDDQVIAIAGYLNAVSLIFTQDNQVISIAGAVENTASVSFTQDDQIVSISGAVENTAAIVFTQDDQAISSSGYLNAVDIAYTQDDSVFDGSILAEQITVDITFANDDHVFAIDSLLADTFWDAWYTSWGNAWGDSWGHPIEVTPPTPEPPEEHYSGGWEEHHKRKEPKWHDYGENIRIREIVELGKEADEVIAKVQRSSKPDALFEDAEDISHKLQVEVLKLEARILELKLLDRRAEMHGMELASNRMKAQIEEIDVAFMMIMIIAHLD